MPLRALFCLFCVVVLSGCGTVSRVVSDKPNIVNERFAEAVDPNYSKHVKTTVAAAGIRLKDQERVVADINSTVERKFDQKKDWDLEYPVKYQHSPDAISCLGSLALSPLFVPVTFVADGGSAAVGRYFRFCTGSESDAGVEKVHPKEAPAPTGKYAIRNVVTPFSGKVLVEFGSLARTVQVSQGKLNMPVPDNVADSALVRISTPERTPSDAVEFRMGEKRAQAKNRKELYLKEQQRIEPLISKQDNDYSQCRKFHSVWKASDRFDKWWDEARDFADKEFDKSEKFYFKMRESESNPMFQNVINTARKLMDAAKQRQQDILDYDRAYGEWYEHAGYKLAEGKNWPLDCGELRKKLENPYADY